MSVDTALPSAQYCIPMIFQKAPAYEVITRSGWAPQEALSSSVKLCCDRYFWGAWVCMEVASWGIKDKNVMYGDAFV